MKNLHQVFRPAMGALYCALELFLFFALAAKPRCADITTATLVAAMEKVDRMDRNIAIVYRGRVEAPGLPANSTMAIPNAFECLYARLDTGLAGGALFANMGKAAHGGGINPNHGIASAAPRGDFLEAMESVTWRRKPDNSIEHVLRRFDGSKTKTWINHDNAGIIEKDRIQGLFSRNMMNNLYGLGSNSWFQLTTQDSWAMSDIAETDAKAGGKAVQVSFSASDRLPVGLKFVVQFSKDHDWLPCKIEVGAKGRLDSRVEVEEFMRVESGPPGEIHWYPKRISFWSPVVEYLPGKPVPPHEIEILSVRLGQLKPADFPPLEFPRGCSVSDRTKPDGMKANWPDASHVSAKDLAASEIPEFFSKLGAGHTLQEAETWTTEKRQ